MAQMSNDNRATAPPRIDRRNHGKGHSYYLDGVKVPGATTVLGKGYPKPALVHWAAKAAAQEVLDRWAELEELPPSDRYELIRTAPDRDRDTSGNRGTDVHNLAQRLAAGEDIAVPDELVGHVDAYLAFATDWGPRELFVEAPVANTRWRYCGTVDTVADLVDGNRWLLDWKTSRSGVFREAALQLSAYRYCDWYLGDDGPLPMPEVDRVGAVWLKADRTYELIPLDAGPETFRVFLYAQQIAAFQERDDVLLAPLQAPDPTGVNG